ncbi:helix-turn-helix transcriptional regulator [Desulfoluna limicola]|nr:WYL domain-containing transcriptional regulator [Desulfoluna limicola]
MARQWKIIQALLTSKTGKTVGDLHKILDLTCDKRSVYRDIQDLEAAGFPLMCETVNGAQYWSVMEHARNPLPIPHKVEELIALYLSKDMMVDLKGTSIYKDLDSLFTKIKAGIHESFHDYLEQSGPLPVVSFQHSAGQLEKMTEEMVSRLEAAIQAKQYVDMTYFTQSRKTETQRRVAPYTLLVSQGSIYLIGHCELRQEVRFFAVNRIRKLVVSDATYVIPEDFQLDQFMKPSFGIYQGPETHVKIRFSSEVADLIKERVWHPSQIITDHTDGSILFVVTVAGTEEIQRWVMGWGEYAMVLEPESLRQDILTGITQMVETYQAVQG